MKTAKNDDNSTYFSLDACFMADDSSNSSTTAPSVVGGSTTALMLWGHSIIQPKNELDSGMMPPPSMTLPMNARRPSLSGILGCSSTDHISPPLLKTELMDESSQGSIIAETMNHDSMDHFVTNENSMDSNSAQQAPISMQATMNMMEPNPMELIMHKNVTINNGFTGSIAPQSSLNGILSMNVTGIDLRVKQEEQIAAQIEQLVNNPNLVENDKILSEVAQQSQQNVNQFLSNLDAKINDLKAQVEAAPMFNTTTASNSTTGNVMYNNAMETNGLVSTQSSMQMGHHQTINQTIDNATAFTTHQALMTEAGTATSINHILSYPTDPATTTMMETSQSNPPPITQDAILNSQSPVVMNSSPSMLSVNSSSSSMSPNMANQSETDIIMNPTISPTMMCQSGSGDASLINNQVISPLGDSTLLPVTVGGSPQSSSPNAMMNNMMPNALSPQNPDQTSLHHIPIKQTPVAVKNMILNAAADILSCEPNSISTENTIHALMSLTTPTLTDVVHPDPQHPQVSASNMTMMQVNDHATLQTQVSSEPMMMQSHNPFENQQTQSMNNMFTQSDASTAVAPVFSNPLMQNVVVAAVQSDMQNQITATEAAMMNNYSMSNMNMNSQIMNMQTSSTSTLCTQQNAFLNDFRYVLAHRIPDFTFKSIRTFFQSFFQNNHFSSQTSRTATDTATNIR